MIFMALKALCFPSRLNLHIGILKKKSYKAKKSYTVLLKKNRFGFEEEYTTENQ